MRINGYSLGAAVATLVNLIAHFENSYYVNGLLDCGYRMFLILSLILLTGFAFQRWKKA